MDDIMLCSVVLDDDVFFFFFSDDQSKVFNFFEKQGYGVIVTIIEEPIVL